MRGNHRRKGMEARNRMVWARDYTSMVFLRHRKQGRNCLGNQAYVDTSLWGICLCHLYIILHCKYCRQ